MMGSGPPMALIGRLRLFLIWRMLKLVIVSCDGEATVFERRFCP